ncbi:MAG: glucuronyl hydrolase [Polyangiaceae bacterium]|nr:glucuronyl hydrolase [Polyangiaceae bacterium]
MSRALSAVLAASVAACAASAPPQPSAPSVASAPPASAAPAPATEEVVALAPQGVAITVENPLPEARGPETIAVKLGDLQRIVPTLEPKKLLVVDGAGRVQLSQLVDTNGDESVDELVFQTNLAAGESKTFRVQPGERKPFKASDYKVYGRFVRERHDDFAFENDKLAHRMYGPALETWKAEPLTSSGIDVWAKRTHRLVINDWYMTDDYHRDNGDGADLYSVNKARGCGGLGVWDAGKLYVSRNFVETRVLAQGPIRLLFELKYPAYDTASGKVVETKRITMDAGRNLNRFESHFKVESGARPATVGIGIAKHKGGTAGLDKTLGLLHSWEPLKEGGGNVGCGIIASPETVEGSQETDLDTLLVANVPPNGPQVYYAGFAWDRRGDFADQKAWLAYAQGFARALRAPLRVSLSNAAERAATPSQADAGWAKRTCDWLVERHPGGLPSWEYDNGLVLRGCEQLGLKTGDARYLDYIKKSIDPLIAADGSIKGFKLEEYQLDHIASGKLLLGLYDRSKDAKDRERYKKALLVLRGQLKAQPRTSDGGFWHKKIYPSQMWLDGLFMAAPFMAELAAKLEEPALYDDVAKQVVLMEQHTRDPKTGLLYHGWDESKKQRWANKSTGVSPEFWGRAVGWYAMGLVDVLDFLPEKHPKRAEVLGALKRLAAAVTAVQDPERGVWWQVMDKPGAPRNYREASATAMLVYTLQKGVRRGWLDKSVYGPVAERGYAGLVKEFASVDAQGNVELRGVCKVAGLGGNPYRDGSYEYYVSTDIASNDPKGLGAFILASVERP